jgi:trehalose 6-phosphate synthase
VSSAAGHINGTHGDAAWTPIRYINQSYGRNVLAGLYRSARVGLVTPLRDGMNLVAKEYLASQNVDDPGVLVLSRFAGAARECEAALIVNPYDADAVANAIARALSMPIEERRERHKSIMRVLTQNDSRFWGDKFLTALELTFDEMSMFADMPTPRPITKARQKTA